MPFRPAPVPTAFVAVGLVILVNLGLWQYRRHGQTSALMAEVDARLRAAPAQNADLARPADELTWRQAQLTGHFVDVEPYWVTNRFEFGHPGYDAVQPFQVDGGPVVLVNRGWLPRDGFDEHRGALLATDPDSVRGLLVAIDRYADARPPLPANAERGELWMPDSYRLMRERTQPAPADVVLVVGEHLAPGEQKQPKPLPVTGYHARPEPRPHLNYMGQWFLIAGTLFSLWLWAGFRRGARLAADADAAKAG